MYLLIPRYSILIPDPEPDAARDPVHPPPLFFLLWCAEPIKKQWALYPPAEDP